MDGSCSDDSEIEEERAGGGPGPTGGGLEQEEDRGRIRADDVYLNAGGGFTNRMTAETLGVRADIVCTYAYGPLRPSVVISKMLLIRKVIRSVGTATSVVVSSFELNQRMLPLHLAIRT
jgi:hypothetical protein